MYYALSINSHFFSPTTKKRKMTGAHEGKVGDSRMGVGRILKSIIFLNSYKNVRIYYLM